MNGEILELFRNKEKLFKDMLDYIQKISFKYTEDEVNAFGNFVRNLSVHTRVIEKNQAEINKYNKNEYGSDREVCEIEERCKALAKKIYEIDKEVNDRMSQVLKDLKAKYISSRNQEKYFSYSNNVNYISESFASFDVKQ